MADRVGAVYVEVLTDTSNVKPQIERAYKDLGERKGTKVAKDWWKAFGKETEAAQKQIRFDQLSRSIDKSLDAVVKAQAARIKKVVREGGRVELKISKKAFADLEKLAKDFDEPLSEVLNQFVEKLPSAYKKAISDAERVLAKEEADREKAEKKRRAAEAAEVAAFQKLRAKAERDYELDQIRREQKRLALIERAEREMELDQINREKQRANRLKNEVKQLELFAEGRNGTLKRRVELLSKEYVAAIRAADKAGLDRQPIIDKARRDLKSLAREYEATYDDISNAFRKITDRDEAKRLARDVRIRQERSARDWQLFKNWQAGRDYNGSLDKLAADIERATTTGTRKAFAKNKDVDFGPAIQKRIDQVIKDSAERYGKSADQVVKALRNRVRVTVLDDVAKQTKAFDAVERKITGFRRRVLTGGGALSKIFIGPFALAAGAAGSVLQVVTAIGPAIASAGGAVAKFGVSVGKVFPRAGAAIGRIGLLLGKIAAPIAAIALPIAIPLAWMAFGFVMSSIVVIFNTLAAAALVAGTAIVGAVSSLALVAGVAAAAAVGYGLFAFGAKDAFSAVGALNKALQTGAKEDFKAYEEALGKLGDNAKAAVKATRPLLESLKGLKSELSEKIFLDTAPLISNLKPLAAAVRSVGSEFGQSINFVFQDLLAKLGNPELVSKIQNIGFTFSNIFTNVGLAINNFFVGFVNSLNAVSPILDTMGGAVKNLSDRFLEWTNSAENMEKLRSWFQKVYDVAAAVWGILGSLLGLIGALFNQSGEATVGWLDRIKAKLDEWTNWVNENRDDIVAFIDDAWATLVNLWNAAKDVFAAFQRLDTPEARKGFDSIVNAIGTVLEWIAKLSSAWTTLKALLFGGIQAKINVTLGGAAWVLNRFFGGGGNGNISVQAQGPSGNQTRQSSSRAGSGPRFLAAGGFIRSPQLAMVGEAGPEVVIPLARPIGMVDPEIRELTKMVRGAVGGGSTGYSQQKVWNVTQNITAPNGSPDLIAAQVLNRFVVAARG